MIGTKLPKYCIFGETVSSVTQMEATSEVCENYSIYILYIQNWVRLVYASW